MNTAIVISSCDKFKDCWEPMIFSIKKYWSDCPFPIYFISNYEEIEDEKIKFIKVGKDLGFCSNLKKALKSIDDKYIIYFQEDYFIENSVNTKSILNHLNYCEENNIHFLKISDDLILKDKFRIEKSIYCLNDINEKYSINTAIAIWNKSKLEELCVDGYSGWDFERKIITYIKKNNIKINSQVIHSSCYLKEGIPSPPETAVRKGKWTKFGFEFLKNNGFNYLISNRKIEGKLVTFFSSIYSTNSILRYPIALLMRIAQKYNL